MVATILGVAFDSAAVDSVGACARAPAMRVRASATPASEETEVRTLSACCGSSFILRLQWSLIRGHRCGAPRLTPCLFLCEQTWRFPFRSHYFETTPRSYN